MKLKAAIIGTGNIGTDLLIKSTRSNIIEPIAFIGRRESSDGIQRAKSLGIKTSIDGIDFFINNPKYCDLVFDCTDAFSATENYKVFSSQNIKTIDLTPAKIGELCVPSINDDFHQYFWIYIQNVNIKNYFVEMTIFYRSHLIRF